MAEYVYNLENESLWSVQLIASKIKILSLNAGINTDWFSGINKNGTVLTIYTDRELSAANKTLLDSAIATINTTTPLDTGYTKITFPDIFNHWNYIESVLGVDILDLSINLNTNRLELCVSGSYTKTQLLTLLSNHITTTQY